MPNDLGLQVADARRRDPTCSGSAVGKRESSSPKLPPQLRSLVETFLAADEIVKFNQGGYRASRIVPQRAISGRRR